MDGIPPADVPGALPAGQGSRRTWSWPQVAALALGLGAFAWFLIRVIPKPSRAAYPCQRAAFPLASAFVLWLAGSLSGMALATRLRRGLRRRPAVFALVGGCAVLFAGWSMLVLPAPGAAYWPAGAADVPVAGYAFAPAPSNRPVGIARGINPGRVVWAHDPSATRWEGKWRQESDQWWTDGSTDQAKVDGMLSAALCRLTSSATDRAAWEAIFRHYNARARGLADRGHAPGEVVAVKINLNNSDSSAKRSNIIDATPQVVLAVVRQLVRQGQVPEADVLVYDGRRTIPANLLAKVWSEFPDVRFVQEPPPQGDQDVNPTYGGHHGLESTEWVHGIDYSAGQFDMTRQIPRQARDSTYLINLALLKAHSYPYSDMEDGDQGQTGVTLCGKNHFGSIRNTWEMHPYINPDDRGRGNAYSPLVDQAAAPTLGGKTILFLIDGLYCGRKWRSYPVHFPNPPFNNRVEPYANTDWPASILASLDGVAIDSVGIDILLAQSRGNDDPANQGRPRLILRENADGYLREMAQADHPPSGTAYRQGGGTVASLGVFEHWDGDATRRYSRNLDPVAGSGIDLQYLPFAQAPVATPVIVPAPGGTVAITCATPGARIQVTLDGSIPTDRSPRYTHPISVPAGAVVRAIACTDDLRDSAIATTSWSATSPSTDPAP